MKSARSGMSTSEVELFSVTQRGLWLLVDGREYHLPFRDFPWFKRASIEQLSVIERPSPDHLRWPMLDVDLTLESIERPGDFPLVSEAPVGDGMEDSSG